jgi:hypothetical protein
MGRNRVLGAPYEVAEMQGTPGAPLKAFTTDPSVDLYLIFDDGVNLVTVTLDPNAQPGDVVALEDATGHASVALPIFIQANLGQTINLHGALASIINPVVRAVLTMGEDNVWYIAFLGG